MYSSLGPSSSHAVAEQGERRGWGTGANMTLRSMRILEERLDAIGLEVADVDEGPLVVLSRSSSIFLLLSLE